ncbi:MAG: calcium-binding protein [Actinomycetota bacterium]
MNIRTVRRAWFLGLAAMALVASLVAGPAHAADSPSASLVGRTLNVNGSGGPDDIVLSVAAADPNTLLLDFDNDGTIDQSLDRATFDAIAVSLGGGDDHFSANGVPGPQTSRIDGRGGDDTIVGTAGDDVITGGRGSDHIVAGPGNDVILGGGGRDFVAGGLGHDTAFLGGGADVFQWDPGEGSDDVDGGGGPDTLLFDGSAGGEIMSLSAVGTRAVFLRQPGNVVMNLDDVEILDLHAFGGADLVTVNDMTGTDVRQADIDLSAAGNRGAGDLLADLVTVNGTGKADVVHVAAQGTQVDVSGLVTETHMTGTDPALDQLQVNTLEGNDTVTVDPSATALIGVTTDLGPGQI